MVEPEREISADAMANIAYLARSQNRIEILETLTTGSHTSRDVEEQTGTSRSTLERITTELEERGWAERNNNGEYVLTETGERIAEETSRYVGAMEAIETLGEAVNWLPNDELTIDLRYFRDAVVWKPEPNDVAAADTRIIDLSRDGDRFACLSNTAGTVGLETEMIEQFGKDQLDVENVVTPEELDIYRQDPERAARWKSYLEAGANVYCYHGQIPCVLILIDETVFIGDRRLETLGVIESSNDAVRSWAEGVLANYRDNAERVEPTDLSRESSSVDLDHHR
ncbi:Predicted transcriptional regulator, contains HTH domain [Halogranum amylolyticum]|uniref:Predicted transcriptional regulator, contains HTH domain n=2 Tax=Halogranum amylolyticum TaxID=660520 RepID=A0A1H8VLG3_9EURY|nr:Predicted transcriptional regulator, contains HTH domain [Halogranum amylolyticum]